MSATALPTAAPDADRTIPLFWLMIFAALSVLALLFAFQQVVHGAVQKAQSERIAANAQAESAWRCKYLPSRAERNQCLAGLSVQASIGRAAPSPAGPALATAAMSRP